MTTVLDANKITSGSWGFGSWWGANPGDYRGFYFLDNNSLANDLVTGKAYLDADNNNIYDPLEDDLIGLFQASSTPENPASFGTWKRTSGLSSGTAFGAGTDATFLITAPLQFSTLSPINIASNWFDLTIRVKGTIELQNIYNLIESSSWTSIVKINSVSMASDNGDSLDGKQKELGSTEIEGSVLSGGKGNDRIQGKAGWDIADGGEGNDLVRVGNGRDILTGGLGSDELWGGFGWNTFKGDRDGTADLLVIKSDEWMVNSQIGKAGNNTNGSKCDIIEELDAIDKIIIQGVTTSDLHFSANVTGQGLSGIGIYANGSLEALYTGGDLTVSQLTSMTTGDLVGQGGPYWDWG